MYFVDLATGKRTPFVVSDISVERATLPVSCFCVSPRGIVVGTNDGRVAAFTRDGTPLWVQQVLCCARGSSNMSIQPPPPPSHNRYTPDVYTLCAVARLWMPVVASMPSPSTAIWQSLALTHKPLNGAAVCATPQTFSRTWKSAAVPPGVLRNAWHDITSCTQFYLNFF